METLESFIGEPKVIRPPLVIADPEPEFEPGEEPKIQVSYPSSVEKRDISLTQEVGEFIIDRLNRQQASFQGQWLVWKGRDKDLANGKLMFELQQHGADEYVPGCMRGSITIRMPRPSLWHRLLSYVHSWIHREAKRCCA